MAKKTTIRCPHCNYEYLPAEIYFPDDFLGKPSEIIRDESGNVLGFQGADMNTAETYCCDHCGHSFDVDASITFKTSAIVDMFEVDEDFKGIIKQRNSGD